AQAGIAAAGAGRSCFGDLSREPVSPRGDARRPHDPWTPPQRRRVLHPVDRRTVAPRVADEGGSPVARTDPDIVHALLRHNAYRRRARRCRRLSAVPERALAMKKSTYVVIALLLLAASYRLDAQVTFDRILHAADEPQNWLTYSGTYMSQRFSQLRQLDTSNVKNLELKWMVQNQVFGTWETSPLVVDGTMYLTQRPNDVMAVDAKTGRMFWLYRYTNSGRQQVCCGAQNRGVAILGDTLFMGTLDAHLVAIDAKNGKPLWNVTVADDKLAYSITLAPLVVKDKVIVGV